VVVVTGASSGIGRATAFYLAEQGFEVLAGVRKEADADSLREEAKETGGRLSPLMIDVTDAESISQAKATVEEAVGERGLAGLVNNAGIPVGGPLEFLPLDDLRRQLEVNLIGQVGVIQALLPLLRKGHGRIVNITSIGGRLAHPFMGPYHASKFGLEAITESLRMELQPWGIWVAAVEPGNVATRIWGKGENEVASFRAKAPEAEGLYSNAIDAFEAMIKTLDGAGFSPEKVAKKVAHALTARRPKPRYLVGADARGMLTARGLLSARAFDRIRTRVMKVPKAGSALK
jgi:NAD(P)-dependent dehydrogenase (short-subunit alcohol dehydrogenase family)